MAMVGSFFEGCSNAEDEGFGEGITNELRADGEAVSQATGNGQGGKA